MKRPVSWSRFALDDLKEQIAFIARNNPVAARRVANRIRDAGIALEIWRPADPVMSRAHMKNPSPDFLISSPVSCDRMPEARAL